MNLKISGFYFLPKNIKKGIFIKLVATLNACGPIPPVPEKVGEI